ncbi:uracil-DNA glycosylase [Longispora urticae]
MDGPRADSPRTNREVAELARKQSLLTEPRIAPLTAHAARIRSERGADRVPDFDPTEAGVHAPILLLLEAPGARATRERHGSGFVSPDNNDQTAATMWHLLCDAGIDRSRDVVTWNVIPWYIGDDTKIRPASTRDLLAAEGYTRQLLALLPALKVVVLIGRKAAKGWSRLGIHTLRTIECPHPSPRNLNTRPADRQKILVALQDARRLAGLGSPTGRGR